MNTIPVLLYKSYLVRSDLKHQSFPLLKQKIALIKHFFNINTFFKKLNQKIYTNCFQFIGILKITIHQRKVNSMYKTIPKKLQCEKSSTFLHSVPLISITGQSQFFHNTCSLMYSKWPSLHKSLLQFFEYLRNKLGGNLDYNLKLDQIIIGL